MASAPNSEPSAWKIGAARALMPVKISSGASAQPRWRTSWISARRRSGSVMVLGVLAARGWDSIASRSDGGPKASTTLPCATVWKPGNCVPGLSRISSALRPRTTSSTTTLLGSKVVMTMVCPTRLRRSSMMGLASDTTSNCCTSLRPSRNRRQPTR
ncbi:hypothetical protein CDO46_05230 [Pigmentiphaga sp. NML030171]|nr:hypothetical protein CDO46_05230 [Pigmentiphaga sp. NML030171]